MRYTSAMTPLVVSGLLLLGCVSTRPTDTLPPAPAFTLDQLLGRMPAKDSLEARWVFSSLMQMGEAGVSEICDRLGPAGSDRNARAEYALQGLATYVMRPGGEADRLLFVSALGKALERPLPAQHASFLLARLEVAGKTESIPVLARFLIDEQLCEPAVQAMLAIRDGAEAPLLSALPTAGRNNRISIIKALGELHSCTAVDQLLKETSAEDTGVQRAALSALASIGDPKAEQVLSRAAASRSGSEGDEAIWDYLFFARRRMEAGFTADAASLARQLIRSRTSTEEGHVRAAALDLLVQSEGERAMGDLLGTMKDPDKALRAAALQSAGRISGQAATSRWITETKGFPPGVRAEILNMLGRRGDRTAVPAILEAISDPDSSVRAAAIEAAARLTGTESVPALLACLQQSAEEGDIAAVRRALQQMPPRETIPRVAPALGRLTPQATAALVEMLAAYGSLVPADPIFQLAKNDNLSVRVAAVKALGSIAPASDQQELIDLLLHARSEEERSAALNSIASVSGSIPNPEERSSRLLAAYAGATPSQRPLLLRALGRIGGADALARVVEGTTSNDAETRDAAVRALADWPTIAAYDSLLAVATGKEKLTLRILALRGCVRMVENASLDGPTAVRYHQRTLTAAQRADEKRLVIGVLGSIQNREALRAVIPYLQDDSLSLDAAMAAGKIAGGHARHEEDLGRAEVARMFIENAVPAAVRPAVVSSFDSRDVVNEPPEGFAALFNGRDLTGWRGLVENPLKRAAMDAPQLAAAQARADSIMSAHWSVSNGILVFDGKGENLCTAKEYTDFELLVDWRIEKDGDSGIYLRGSPQVQIWDPARWPEGSGGLYNNQQGPGKPLLRADNPVGEWNTFRIRMIGERVTVWLNDVLVVDSVALENYWDRTQPIFPTGQIELQSHNTPLFFRNIYLREIPRESVPSVGPLFNGADLTGWEIVGGKEGSWGARDGVLFTSGDGGGWISTVREFGDFQLDLDFRVPEGGNSGVFIRSPREGDPAYVGMEIQVLDDYAARYATLKPWQYTGSIYGVQSPSVRATERANEWQQMQILADGPHVKVTLNGQLIVDADLIAHMDKESSHPGLKRRGGFIGLQNHGSKVEYRNIVLRQIR